jgi:exodeoxyribonuclease V alpha subunit
MTTTSAATQVRGRVETVFFASPRWSAGRLRTEDGEKVSFAGALMVKTGDAVVLHGVFEKHAKYGLQLKVHRFTFDQRLDAEGLVHFLANHPDIEGIGPVKARRIAEAFGADFDRAIDEEPERVAAVAKIPAESAHALRDAWLATRTLNAAMTWLASFDLTHHQVTALVEKFGNSVVTVLQTDPYLLVREIPGFGFKRVDVVARKMGVPKEHPSRLRAGVLHCVAERLDQGDCWVEYEDLVGLANTLLVLDVADSRERIERALDTLIDEQALACVSLGGRFLVAQPALHEMECDLAEVLTSARENPHFVGRDVGAIADLAGGGLNAPQRRALLATLRRNLVLVCGGAGVGKTYLVAAITRTYEAEGRSVVLAAPTGKAAKRIEQVVGREAKTLHRLLGFDGHAFAAGPDAPIDADVVIVDEVSMVDVPLAWHFFRAVDFSRTAVVLVGDHNQLPPVGPGNLLRDLIERRPIETVVLDEVVRQAGVLKENSTAILRGHVAPSSDFDEDGRLPWFVLNRFEDVLDAQRYLLALFEGTIRERLGFDLLADVQLLTPTRKGPLGVDALNVLLQRLVQRKLRGIDVLPPPAGRRPDFLFGDRVLQTRNNYDLGVMNGAIGIVVSVGVRRGDLTVRFDHGEVAYTVENEGATSRSRTRSRSTSRRAASSPASWS